MHLKRTQQHSTDVWLEFTYNYSLASQPLFLRGGARGGGREKESGDLSQHFVFSAGMWVEPMRLQQSHDFHSVIQTVRAIAIAAKRN